MRRKFHSREALLWDLKVDRIGYCKAPHNPALQGTLTQYLSPVAYRASVASGEPAVPLRRTPELSRCTKPLRGSLPTEKPCQ